MNRNGRAWLEQHGWHQLYACLRCHHLSCLDCNEPRCECPPISIETGEAGNNPTKSSSPTSRTRAK